MLKCHKAVAKVFEGKEGAIITHAPQPPYLNNPGGDWG